MVTLGYHKKPMVHKVVLKGDAGPEVGRSDGRDARSQAFTGEVNESLLAPCLVLSRTLRVPGAEHCLRYHCFVSVVSRAGKNCRKGSDNTSVHV